MRRALAPLAALLVAACQVDVEGARCRVPGATSDCPAGQACGNDARCTERAAGCVATASFCVSGTRSCRGGAVQACSSDGDPVCGAWSIASAGDDCGAARLVCEEASPGNPACVCGAPTDEILVDASRPSSNLSPTGASEPAECRFVRITDALEYASVTWVPAHAGAAATVRLVGSALGNEPLVFADESFPLIVAAGVTLRAEASHPIVIRAPSSSVSAPLVEVTGALDGGSGRLRIEGHGAAATGVRASCGPSGKPTIANVTVDGGGTLTKGVDVEGGACGAELSRVDVSNVNGPALEVGGDALGEAVSVTASAFRGSVTGIRARGGKLRVGSGEGASVEVTGNAGDGVVLGKLALEEPTQTLDVELARADVAGNGGTGIVLNVVKSDSRLAVRSCDISSNGREQPWPYGSSVQRTVGGVFIRQGVLSEFTMLGNRLWSNAGDQLAFETSGTTWSLASGATSCSSDSNLFACVAEGTEAIGVAGSGLVTASYSVWPGTPWDEWATPGVSIASPGAWCEAGAEGAPTPPATCPAP